MTKERLTDDPSSHLMIDNRLDIFYDKIFDIRKSLSQLESMIGSTQMEFLDLLIEPKPGEEKLVGVV